MKLFTRLFVAVALIAGFAACNQTEGNDVDYTAYVNPYIGTGEHGHVFVGANVPFGAIQVGPQNIYKGWDWCSGYHYSDSILIGFSHTHLSGTGCADLGDILVMPYVGEVRTARGEQDNIEGAASIYYNHDQEELAPGYYKIAMENGVTAEMTATERVALHHYTFPADTTAHILFNLLEGNGCKAYATHIKKVDEYTVEGYRYLNGWAPTRKIFFVAKFQEPIAEMLVFSNDEPAGTDSLTTETQKVTEEDLDKGNIPTQNGAKAVITMKDDAKDVSFKVAISSVSCENAQMNMDAELADFDFAKTRQQAIDKWNKKLSQITVDTDDEVEREKFYTAMYHLYICPQLFCDVNGEFRGIDDKVRKVDFNNYSCLSQWDVYRTQMPLLTILNPDVMQDFVKTYMSIYDQNGKLPIWALQGGETECMPGYSSIIIMADAYLKGLLTDEVAEEALEKMVASAKYDKQKGVTMLMETGFIADDKIHEATSIALEYAVGDAGIALMAKKMGKEDIYQYFKERSKAYATYYDKEMGFIRPKNADGSWMADYEPRFSQHGGHFCEGTGWQYTFFNPQNPEFMIQTMGDDATFCQKLDALFEAEGVTGEHASADISGLIGQYAHGNEPSHPFIYYYPYAGEQWKTAKWVRFVQKDFYTNKPEGIIGNEDCGQMSAWYIMSSLGFYQVSPSGGKFVIGSPTFKKSTVHLTNGKTFTVSAPENSDENIYVQSVKLNGKDYTKTWITYEDIMKGGTLEFVMGPEPNKEYGAAKEDRPTTEE